MKKSSARKSDSTDPRNINEDVSDSNARAERNSGSDSHETDIDSSGGSIQSSRESSYDPSLNPLKHGAAGYERGGKLPVEWEGYDRELARDLLSDVGGMEKFSLACVMAARRATLVEMAFSWLARDDVEVFWVEEDDTGKNIVRFQPVLTRLFGWMNGLRRDLAELNLTPAQSARLMPDDGILDAGRVLEVVKNEQNE